MKQPLFIVEGRSDEALWSVLLDDVQPKVRFYVANGKDRAAAIARRAMAEHDGPLIVVLDADSSSDDVVAREEGLLRAYLVMGGRGGPFFAHLIRPEIEVLFFRSLSREVEQDVFGRLLTSAERVAGRFAPKEMLQELLGHRVGMNELILRLSPASIDALRGIEPACDVRSFIQKNT